MPIKNPTQLLMQAVKYPAAIEAKLPAGAPVISTMLLDIAGKIPAAIPDFPMEIPDLPAAPELPAPPGGAAAPELPAPPGGAAAGLKRYVTSAEVTPAPARSTVTPLVQAYTQPIEGVLGQVTTRRGM